MLECGGDQQCKLPSKVPLLLESVFVNWLLLKGRHKRCVIFVI
jgi:hypothetical protein